MGVILIGIVGMSCSGKTTLAKHIENCFDDDESRCRRVSFADPLKEEVAKLNNISLNELITYKEKYRQQLIEVGQAKRAVDPDYWTKKWKDTVLTLVNSGDVTEVIIADDVRFSNEIDTLLSIDAGYKDDERIIDTTVITSLYVDEAIRRERGCRIFNDPTEQDPSEILNGSTYWREFNDYITVTAITRRLKPIVDTRWIVPPYARAVASGVEGLELTHQQTLVTKVLWDGGTPDFVKNALKAYVRGVQK
jgi:phosphomevalonate kinase